MSEAPLERVAAIARATVEEVGGVVAQNTETTTEFDSLVPQEGDWAREGYVGTYQNYGEDPVRLRIRVWAGWPRALFLWTVFLGLAQAVVFLSLSLIGLSPSANVWIFSAIATFALLAIATVMYASSWAADADLEDEIARELTSRISEDEEIPGPVYTLGEWEEHRAEVLDRAVAEADEKAPDRPSRTRKVLQTVGVGGGTTTDQAADEEPEPGEADEREPDEEPGAAQPDETEADEPDDEADDEGVLDKLAFWRGGDEDEAAEAADAEPDEEPGAADPDEDADAPDEEPDADEADDEGVLDKLAFWRGGEDDADEADDA